MRGGQGTIEGDDGWSNRK